VIALLGASTEDHDCPYENAGSNSNIEIRGKRCKQLRLILPLASDGDVLRREESLAMQRSQRQTRRYKASHQEQ
jgi:hypothetical protein